MFLRKAFLVLPSLVWAMTKDEADSLSGAIGFLAPENNHPLMKTEKTPPINPPENPSDEYEETTSSNASTSSSNIVVSSGVGGCADAAANDAPEPVPEQVENTQSRTVTVDAVLMSGRSVGKFEVSSIRELRTKVAAARGARPRDITLLLRGYVILKDSESLSEFEEQEWVQVVQEQQPAVVLSTIVKEIQGRDWQNLDDRTSVKAKYWERMMEALKRLFRDYDDFSCEPGEQEWKSRTPVKMGSTNSSHTTTKETPDCLNFRVQTLETIWNAMIQLFMVDGFNTEEDAEDMFGHDSPPSFRDIVGYDFSELRITTVIVPPDRKRRRFDRTGNKITRVKVFRNGSNVEDLLLSFTLWNPELTFYAPFDDTGFFASFRKLYRG